VDKVVVTKDPRPKRYDGKPLREDMLKEQVEERQRGDIIIPTQIQHRMAGAVVGRQERPPSNIVDIRKWPMRRGRF